jgi:signal transduction histidine kinase
VADGLLALILTLAGVAQLAYQEPDHPLRLLPVAGTTLPLAWRRRAPLLCYGIQFAAALATGEPPTFAGLLAIFIGIYSIGAHSRWRLRSLGAPLASALILQVLFPDSQPPLSAGAATAVVGLAAWLAGNAIRDRQARADALEERARRLEREQALATQVALAEERARIARELHDVVAHNVSLMVVQAGAARLQVGQQSGPTVEALRAVEGAGREALTELRRMLGLLTDGGEAPALAPAPGLSQLDALVARVGGAGLSVSLRIEGCPRPLPPALELTAYRIIQEGLTNALKHAAGARTEVVVAYAERELRLDVLNDRVAAGPELGSRVNGAGRGLLGMQQRVALYGGHLEAGQQPGGGFAVRVRLPVPSA